MITTTLLMMTLAATDPTVISVTGRVELIASSGETSALARFATVPAGATIATYENAFAAVRFPDGSMLRMGEKTRMTIGKHEQREPAARRTTTVKLTVGRIWARVMDLMGQDSSFNLETQNAVAGVRGTAFFASADADGETFVVDFGGVQVQSGAQTLSLSGPGAHTRTHAGSLSPATRLGPRELNALRRAVAGRAGGLVANLRHGSRLPSTERTVLGHLLAGPDAVADTPVLLTPPTDQLGNTADVTVHVRKP